MRGRRLAAVAVLALALFAIAGQASAGGNWLCNGVPCAPNTTVQSSMTTARYITLLY